jgi:hypothetical protein
LAVAHLRCFDARLTKPDGSIKFNWWDRNNDFIKGVRRVPPYSDLFWAMFYKIAPFLGGMKKLILDAKTAEDVEEIRKMRVKVSIPDEHNEGEFITTEVPLLSTEVRAMIDNMLFLACYGHKVMFEDRVPQSSILAFRSCAWKNARENESNFYYLWKEYLARSGGVKDGPDVAKELTDRVNDVMGDDNDDEAAAAAPAAAASAEGGSASDDGGVA